MNQIERSPWQADPNPNIRERSGLLTRFAMELVVAR
jgi:hypothetical protein